MQPTLQLSLLVGVFAISLARVAECPVSGTWDATSNGRKAVTLNVRETDGILGGALILYTSHDSPALPLAGTAWDGRSLRFSVDVPGAAKTDFELTLTSLNKGELKCTGPHGTADVFSVTRRRER